MCDVLLTGADAFRKRMIDSTVLGGTMQKQLGRLFAKLRQKTHPDAYIDVPHWSYWAHTEASLGAGAPVRAPEKKKASGQKAA